MKKYEIIKKIHNDLLNVRSIEGFEVSANSKDVNERKADFQVFGFSHDLMSRYIENALDCLKILYFHLQYTNNVSFLKPNDSDREMTTPEDNRELVNIIDNSIKELSDLHIEDEYLNTKVFECLVWLQYERNEYYSNLKPKQN